MTLSQAIAQEAAESTTPLDLLKYAVALVVSLAAITGAVGVLAKSRIVGRPLRWLWRRNISEPIGGWAQENVRTVVDARILYLMTHNNGGSSLKDLADNQQLIKDQVEDIQTNVSTLLAHDKERDVDGKRYGTTDASTPNADQPKPETEN